MDLPTATNDSPNSATTSPVLGKKQPADPITDAISSAPEVLSDNHHQSLDTTNKNVNENEVIVLKKTKLVHENSIDDDQHDKTDHTTQELKDLETDEAQTNTAKNSEDSPLSHTNILDGENGEKNGNPFSGASDQQASDENTKPHKRKGPYKSLTPMEPGEMGTSTLSDGLDSDGNLDDPHLKPPQDTVIPPTTSSGDLVGQAQANARFDKIDDQAKSAVNPKNTNGRNSSERKSLKKKRLLQSLGNSEVLEGRRQIKRPPQISYDLSYELSPPKALKRRKSTSSTSSSTAGGHVKMNWDSFGDLNATDSTSDQDDAGEYEVEAIRSHKTYRKRVLRYEVKWKNYPESDNTNEPADIFHEDCTDMVVKYWLSQPADIPRPDNIPAAAKGHPEKTLHPTAPKYQSTSAATQHTVSPGPSSRELTTPNRSTSATATTKVTQQSDFDIDDYNMCDLDDDLLMDMDMDMDMVMDKNANMDLDTDMNMNLDTTFDMDPDHGINRSSHPRQTSDYDSDNDSSNFDSNFGFEDDEDANDYNGLFPGKPTKNECLYEPESPKTPISSNNSDSKKRPQKNSNAKSTRSTPPINDNQQYIAFIKENKITQKAIAHNYKDDGYELAYSRQMRPIAKTFDWASGDFTIQNVLPLKPDPKQLMAYIIWPNGRKTVHLIQELHDRCAKKLCLFYEGRINYS